MRIGIISDTHGRVATTQRALSVFQNHDIAEVIHCGDIGSPAIVACFTPWYTHFVLGNVDWDESPLVEAIRTSGQQFHGRFGSVELEHIRIAFLHGDDSRRLHQEIESATWDLICHGHTHVAEQRTEGRTMVLNPGAVHRAAPPSVAIVELPSLEVQFHKF